MLHVTVQKFNTTERKSFLTCKITVCLSKDEYHFLVANFTNTDSLKSLFILKNSALKINLTITCQYLYLYTLPTSCRVYILTSWHHKTKRLPLINHIFIVNFHFNYTSTHACTEGFISIHLLACLRKQDKKISLFYIFNIKYVSYSLKNRGIVLVVSI